MPASGAPVATAVLTEATPHEALRSSRFWVLWATFASAIFGGLMAVSVIPAFGTRVLDLSALEAATAVTVFAVVNGLGRPLAGLLADRIGAVSVLIATYVLQAAALLTLPVFVVDLPTLYGFAAAFGWGFAATLALFPVLTSVCFGVENLGFIYGLLFTAFGVGALGPVLGSWMFDATGSYTPAFLVSGALALTALALGTLLKFRNSLRCPNPGALGGFLLPRAPVRGRSGATTRSHAKARAPVAHQCPTVQGGAGACRCESGRPRFSVTTSGSWALLSSMSSARRTGLATWAMPGGVNTRRASPPHAGQRAGAPARAIGRARSNGPQVKHANA
jgi:MFS family permease